MEVASVFRIEREKTLWKKRKIHTDDIKRLARLCLRPFAIDESVRDEEGLVLELFETIRASASSIRIPHVLASFLPSGMECGDVHSQDARPSLLSDMEWVCGDGGVGGSCG